MEMFLLYLLLVLPNVQTILLLTGTAGLFIFGFITGMLLVEEGTEAQAFKSSKKGLTWSIIFVVIAALLPSERAVAVLGAGYLVTKAVQVEGVEDIPANAVALLNQVMEEALKEKEGK